MSALLNQSLQIMSPEGVFATNEVLSINPGIHEIFSTVDYKYDLYTNGSRNYTGNAPVIYISYTHTGETNLSVRVIANITIAEAGWPVETHVREGWANLTIKLKGNYEIFLVDKVSFHLIFKSVYMQYSVLKKI